ncbi:hypothetical protein LQ757_03255 [Agromyces sp. SYSU K20354]|uniref:hypothetical protein n=1 Tax=Agromyces cavernae TaxID=2898659 RepID=UPI001E560AA4|nr:hypothetical protein [Agromyces cavernae]MCD2441289.1 hypothetical protein [Agromyces cavernae]
MLKDLLITLEDTPGEGAKLGEALGNASINIEGLCAVVDEGRGIVHVLVEDAAAARAAIAGAGLSVEREVDVIVSPPIADADVDKPGVFGAMARALADAGINVTLGYMASRNRVVLGTSDNTRAQQVLQSMM